MPRRPNRPAARTTAAVQPLERRRLLAITPVDAAADGGTSNLGASELRFSQDGRFATFLSSSTDLVAAPLTTFFQIYRRNLVSGQNQLVSIADGDRAEANNDAITADLSADGRYVAFETTATDVVGDDLDANPVSDVYVRDMSNNRVTLVSRSSAGAVGGELVAISADGEQVLFRSSAVGSSFVRGLVDLNNADDLFVFNRRTGRFACVSLNGNGTKTANRGTTATATSGEASFSNDGRFVLFPSRASDLVAGGRDGNTFQFDLFVHDLRSRTTEYASARLGDATRGGNDASGLSEITADGRYVIFRSEATNLVGVDDENDAVDIFVRDRQTDTTRILTVNTSGDAAALPPTDGLPGTPGDPTAPVVDVEVATTGRPDITADGRFAVFTSPAVDLVDSDENAFADAFLVDLTGATPGTTLISSDTLGTGPGNAHSGEATITDDGLLVAFTTKASNLPGDLDKLNTDFAAIYVRDTRNGNNTVVSADRGGNPADADSGLLQFSADGTRLGFFSESENLVLDDSNNEVDPFVVPSPGRSVAEIDRDGKLVVLGSPVADQINVQRVNSQIVVRRNDERLTFRVGDVKSIDILAGDGDDSITLGSNLTLGAYVSAGSGDDRVAGSGGNDRLQGGPGRDTLLGGEGDDRLDGGKNNDRVFGEAGDDNLFGGDSDDLVEGGGGTDRLSGDLGRDTLVGGGSNDRFYGGDDSVDQFIGGTGTDTAVRKDANDILDSIENG